MFKIKGIIYSILSAIIFGIMPILAHFAYENGINSFTLVFLRSFFAIFILLIYLIYKKYDLKLNTNQLKSLIPISIIGYTLTMLTLFTSYKYISIGQATTLHFTYPVVVTFLSVIFFKEKINIQKVIALILSVTGIYMLVGNSTHNINILGITLALSSGLFYSYYLLGIAHSKIKSIDCYVLTFYLAIFASIFLFIIGIITNQLCFTISMKAYLISILIALLTSIIAVIALQIGVKILGASTASILSTFEPIVGVLLGIVILGESFSLISLLGSILVITAVVLITTSKNRVSN